jgi:hypothetical protein
MSAYTVIAVFSLVISAMNLTLLYVITGRYENTANKPRGRR